MAIGIRRTPAPPRRSRRRRSSATGTFTKKIEPKKKCVTQGAAGDRSEGDRDAGRGAPETERLGPLATVLEDDRQASTAWPER